MSAGMDAKNESVDVADTQHLLIWALTSHDSHGFVSSFPLRQLQLFSFASRELITEGCFQMEGTEAVLRPSCSSGETALLEGEDEELEAKQDSITPDQRPTIRGTSKGGAFLSKLHHSWFLAEVAYKRTLQHRLHRTAVTGIQPLRRDVEELLFKLSSAAIADGKAENGSEKTETPPILLPHCVGYTDCEQPTLQCLSYLKSLFLWEQAESQSINGFASGAGGTEEPVVSSRRLNQGGEGGVLSTTQPTMPRMVFDQNFYTVCEESIFPYLAPQLAYARLNHQHRLEKQRDSGDAASSILCGTTTTTTTRSEALAGTAGSHTGGSSGMDGTKRSSDEHFRATASFVPVEAATLLNDLHASDIGADALWSVGVCAAEYVLLSYPRKLKTAEGSTTPQQQPKLVRLLRRKHALQGRLWSSLSTAMMGLDETAATELNISAPGTASSSTSSSIASGQSRGTGGGSGSSAAFSRKEWHLLYSELFALGEMLQKGTPHKHPEVPAITNADSEIIAVAQFVEQFFVGTSTGGAGTTQKGPKAKVNINLTGNSAKVGGYAQLLGSILERDPFKRVAMVKEWHKAFSSTSSSSSSGALNVPAPSSPSPNSKSSGKKAAATSRPFSSGSPAEEESAGLHSGDGAADVQRQPDTDNLPVEQLPLEGIVTVWRQMVERIAALEAGSIRAWEVKPTAVFLRLLTTLRELCATAPNQTKSHPPNGQGGEGASNSAINQPQTQPRNDARTVQRLLECFAIVPNSLLLTGSTHAILASLASAQTKSTSSPSHELFPLSTTNSSLNRNTHSCFSLSKEELLRMFAEVRKILEKATTSAFGGNHTTQQQQVATIASCRRLLFPNSLLDNVYGDGGRRSRRKEKERSGARHAAPTSGFASVSPPASPAAGVMQVFGTSEWDSSTVHPPQQSTGTAKMPKNQDTAIATAVIADDLATLEVNRERLFEYPSNKTDFQSSLRQQYIPRCGATNDTGTAGGGGGGKKQQHCFLPATLRGELWGVLLDVPGPVHREEAVDRLGDIERTPTISDRQIALDIPRCHQYNKLLASTEGHAKLYRLLRMWLIANPHYNYWQGLDSVCATLISTAFDDEPLLLACLEKVVTRFVPHYYSTMAMDSRLVAYGLVLKYHDPQLALHLAEVDCRPELYCVSWFLTLFAHVFPLLKVYLIWDALFLSDDPQFVVCVAVAIVTKLRGELLQSDFGGCTSVLSSVQGLDLRELVLSAWTIYQQCPASVLSPQLDDPMTASLVRLSTCPLMSPTEMVSAFLSTDRCIAAKCNDNSEPGTLSWLDNSGCVVLDIRTLEELQDQAVVLPSSGTCSGGGDSTATNRSSASGGEHPNVEFLLVDSQHPTAAIGGALAGTGGSRLHGSTGMPPSNNSLSSSTTGDGVGTGGHGVPAPPAGKYVRWIRGSVWFPYEIDGWSEAVSHNLLAHCNYSIAPKPKTIERDQMIRNGGAPLGASGESLPAKEGLSTPVPFHIVLVAGRDPESAQSAAEDLQKWGYPRVSALLGGIDALHSALAMGAKANTCTARGPPGLVDEFLPWGLCEVAHSSSGQQLLQGTGTAGSSFAS